MLNNALLTTVLLLSVSAAHGSFIAFEAAGAASADITATRDAFRTAVGGGTVAGANGSFGGERREINWDGVPSAFADPNPLPPTSLTSIRRVAPCLVRPALALWLAPTLANPPLCCLASRAISSRLARSGCLPPSVAQSLTFISSCRAPIVRPRPAPLA